MHVITHFLTGWAATLPLDVEPRDRNLIAAAAVVPDLDGLVVVADLAQGKALDSCDLYATYHHLLCHNLPFAMAAALALGALGRRTGLVGLVSLAMIHIHFLADLVGSAGPEGSIWAIPYLAPFSDAWTVAVSWQWALNGWPNIAFTVGLLVISLRAAWSRGHSPIGVFSRRADQAMVATLRNRFGSPP
jgi:membrane-bound metal-dependent hydrolase YbcI (DUF457 family)